MSRQNHKEKAVKAKSKELMQLSQQRVEVVKSMGGLKQFYGDLTRRMDKVKAEIRLLGGKIPEGREYNERLVLGRLGDRRALHDLRP
ncbi:unnamed protein product [marine sediment metagenome]|uniref:Uncharacterized protein n=1 Tax=marine sediment metagenome TaxID=412755 RepID=X1RLN8_9ZZZZ